MKVLHYKIRIFAFQTIDDMKKTVILSFLFAMFALMMQARNISYQMYDSVKIASILRQSRHKPRTTNFQLFFARKFLGRPYVAHTLDGSSNEHLIVNTRGLDCTTFVETVAALTICAYHHTYSFEAFCSTLERLRYRNGKINGYASRLHYFSDWISDGIRKGTVTDISTANVPFSSEATVQLNYMSTHANDYTELKRNPRIIPEIEKAEQAMNGKTVRYIPKKLLAANDNSLKCIHDGDIIAIVSSKKGLDIAHLGFAVWHKDGKLHLLNASYLRKKVVDETMSIGEYMKQHSSFLGIRIIRIRR
jgi:hypothetical protein